MPGSYSLGDAEGTIRIKYDSRGVKDASNDIDDFSKRATKAQGNFRDVATTTGVAAGVLAAGIGLAVNAAIDFEKRVSAIGAVSGATADQMELLRKKALQLGQDTAFSASEAALAMEELVKSGLSVEDVLNGAADATVALAAAGEVSLPEAAKIASNAMNQFQLAAQDLPHIADLIAGAANASAIDVSEFGLAMSQAGAVANLVGLSFDDLATAIALLGNAGVKGSDAGTSLKTMLQNLQPTTTKQIELFKELGIMTENGTNRFFDQQGHVKSLADIAGILNVALKDMTDQQKSMALETIFGSDAIRAAAVLTQAGADGFNELAGAMDKVKAADVAKARLDNVAGSIEQLKGSLETAAIMFGTALLPVIRKVTDIITFLVNKFSALDERWQKLIAFGAVAVTVLLGVVAAIATLGAIVAGVAASLAALKIAAIIVGVIAAVAALAVGIKLLYDRSQAFRDLLGTIGQYFKAAFGFVMSIITPIFHFIKDVAIPAVQEMAQKLITNLAPAFKAIGDFIQNRVVPGIQKLQAAIAVVMPYILGFAKFLLEVAKVIVNILGKALGFLIPLLLNILGPVFSFLIDAIAGVISFIPTLIGWIKKVIDVFILVGKWVAIGIIAPFYAIYVAAKWVFEQVYSVVKTFIDAFMAVWNFLWPVIKAVFDLIVAIIGFAFDIISTIFQVWWAGIKLLWDFVWAYLIQPVVATFQAIWNFLKAAFEVIASIAKAGWDVIVAIWGFIYDWIVTPIVTAFNAVVDWIKARMDEVATIARAVWDVIVALFTAARDRIVAVVQGFTEFVTKIREHFNNAKQAAITKAEELVAWVKDLPNKIISAIGNLGSMLFNAGKALIQGFWDGMKSIWNSMTSWVEDGMSWLRGLWPFSPAKHGPFSGKGWVLYSGQALVEGFAQGIDSRSDVAANSAQNALEKVAMVLPTDHSAAVASSQLAISGTPAIAGATTSTSNSYGDVHITVKLDDIQSVKDLEELWEWIDNLRNTSRTGMEVPA